MAKASGYRTVVTHIFVAGDKYLQSDPVFGVKASLIDDFPQQSAAPPDGHAPVGPWRKLAFEFRLQRGE
jgi:hydroxyquinol 1,2-dioxygenase